MKKESLIKPTSGYPILFLELLILAAALFGLIALKNPWALFLVFIFFFLSPGFYIVNPNHSKVMVLFGAYKGTVKKNGFFWTNPFFTKRNISLRARNFDSERVKVNDM